jgi:glycosyltransferase involved in cell wall biosynthesis
MRISVVIPLYNKRNSIGAALNSVLMQSFKPVEIIVVNDGSTDGSEDIVNKLEIPLVKLINQSNAGVSAARNRGINEATCDWIALLDADDIWLPGFLAKIRSLHENFENCNILGTSYLMQNQEGRTRKIKLNKLPFKSEDGLLSNYFEVASVSNYPLWSSAIVIRKKTIESVGGFPLNVHSGEDLLTWARLVCISNVAYSTEPLAVYRLNEAAGIDRRSTGPPKKDFVAMALNELKKNNTRHPEKHIRHFISVWHKSRASILIRHKNRRSDALKEIVKSIRNNPFNFKVYLYTGLLLLPARARKSLFDYWLNK